MKIQLILLLSLVLLGSRAYEQTSDGTPNLPSFNYHKDFKQIFDSTQESSSPVYYQKLIRRFLDKDSSLTNSEVLALMIGYTQNPHYKPMEDMEKELEIFDLNKNGECREAIHKARPFLQTHPLSLLVLREISFAYQQVSKKEFQKKLIMDSAVLYQDSGIYFMALNDKIMEAMIYSGKGKTPETAIFSLGLADGEYFIPNVGYKIEKKDTDWNKFGDFMEIIKTIIGDQSTVDYYFVIQHAKQKIDDDEANAIGEKQQKKTDSKKKDKATKEKEAKDKKEKENQGKDKKAIDKKEKELKEKQDKEDKKAKEAKEKQEKADQKAKEAKEKVEQEKAAKERKEAEAKEKKERELKEKQEREEKKASQKRNKNSKNNELDAPKPDDIQSPASTDSIETNPIISSPTEQPVSDTSNSQIPHK
jgi:chemotaxis protein histidine kinase CheA